MEAGFRELSMQYLLSGKMHEICPEEFPADNLSFQMLLLDADLKFYKFIEAKSLTIPKSDKFEDLPAKIDFKVE